MLLSKYKRKSEAWNKHVVPYLESEATSLSADTAHPFSLIPWLLELDSGTHGQRSMVGYSPWGCKESDMTERLHFHFHSGMGDPLFMNIKIIFAALRSQVYNGHDVCSGLNIIPQDRKWFKGRWLLVRRSGMCWLCFYWGTMAPYSSTLAWKIPWTQEPGRLQFMGSLRVRHDWASSLSLFTFMHWRRKWQPTPVFLSGESQGRGSLVGCRLWGRTELDTIEVT